jgi:Uma2 family endonuclease
MTHLARFGPSPFNVALFHEWLDTRSAGGALGADRGRRRPLVGHQRIASNFENHLNDALARNKPAWRADREIGIELSDDSPYRPEPEIAVVDADIDTTRRGVDRFYLIVEVRSESDRERLFASKLDFYKSHPHNRWIVVVEQDRVEAVIHERQEDGGWILRRFKHVSDVLSFGEIGEVCALGDLYRDTNLDPARKRPASS